MLKKTINFMDLDGNPVSEDFYFQLNKAEITEMELSQKGGLGEHLKAIIASEDGGAIISTFKNILASAVGKKSEDGRRFIKSEEITNDFLQSEAYPEMFMELVTNADAASEFIRGIMPADLAAKIDTGAKVTNLRLPDEEVPAWIREDRDPTDEEVRSMSAEQLKEAYLRKNRQS